MGALNASKKYLDRGIAEKLVQQIKSTLLSVSKPKKIIWFGSSYNGRFSDHSDVDLLIVMSGREEIRAAQKALRPYMPLSHFPVDLVWVTQDRFEKMSSIGGVCMVAQNEGKLIHPETHCDQGKAT